jgi:serine/threonine protein kinase/Flp pilus assembly protein TadD
VTPERWKRLRAAIEAALEASSPAEREAALAQACAEDPTLLSEARSIMQAAGEGDDLPGSPPILASEDTGAETRPTLLGRRLAHYQIEERLGAGGMGEVFRARDLALDRESALKVLPRRVRPALRQRLLREAEAGARLQHPCIATFFEAGEEDGEAFIAMEFVRGETLRARLKRGPLPLDETLALASCLLGALGHAHAAGVLHRDIKPDNVMVTGPRSAKLLDFGLATWLAAERAEDVAEPALTAEGAVIGTLGYMSPEQVLGHKLDARSDLFQVGIVLYECLTGTHAFGRSSPDERLAAIMARDLDLAGLSGRGLPAGLAPILARALSRAREHRYPTAMAFLRDLAGLQDGRVSTALPDVLAVMDLENLTRDPEVDWLGIGIAETLVSDLTRVSAIEVLPRARVARALAGLGASGSGSPTRDLELGLALGCGWVLAGGYQKAGNAVRITTRLTEVSTGRVTATEKVDGTLDEIFAVQDRLTRAVLASLSIESPTPAATTVRPAVQVYELVTRARALDRRVNREEADQAIELLEQALQLDPAYAPAHAVLSSVYGHRSIATTRPEDLDSAIQHADRAIQLDPQNARAHTHKGYALWRQGRWDAVGPVLRQAVELDPSDADAHYMIGATSLLGHQYEEMLPPLQRAVELEPLMGFAWLALGTAHLVLLSTAEARYAFVRALELEHNAQAIYPSAGAAAYLAEALRMEGRLEEGRRRALEGIEAAEASDHSYRDMFRALGLCVLGRIALQQGDLAAARAAYAQVTSQLRGRTRPRACGHLMVQALAGLGRTGNAAAYEEGLDLAQRRHTWDFGLFYGCQHEQGLLELARAAQALGRSAQTQALLARAREAGSLEALDPGRPRTSSS